MASNILPSAQQYIDDTAVLDLAYLVSIELPGTDGAFINVTNYKRDIFFSGQTYSSGRLKKVSGISRTAELTASPVSISITGVVQEEIDRAMSSASYLNRRIRVWQAIRKEDGTLLEMNTGVDAILLFEGAISEVSVKESATNVSSDGTSEVIWKCASEFYELDRVNGRITDDDAHRGLIVDSDGNEIASNAAKKPEYQEDLGFFHSNQSIDILATYQTEEKRTKMVKKSKGLFGMRTDYKMVEYYETVTKEVDMRFNLASKYIPVVYGVQQVQGIPIFADTLLNDSSTVYVVYALCEGEIEGFLDFYLDEKPIICYSTEDSEDRECLGSRYLFGDTIGTVAVEGGEGPNGTTVHGTEYIYDDGNGPISMWAFHGKNDQTAAQVLVDIAGTDGFHLQGDQGQEYWSDKFKLIDTAYVVMKVKITDTRTNIPTIHADVRGKKVSTYDESGFVSADETTLNPAWQMLDYLRSPIYGVGINLDRIDLPSFQEVAEIFEAQDDAYEATWNPHWRYIGWNEQDNSNRFVMQTNTRLDTDITLFKNMDTMLKQVICSLNIINGKYTLTVESEGKEPIIIPEHHIVDGAISVSDITSKNRFNTASATIEDPGLGWKTNNITFYEGDFLNEDLHVEKKMSLAFPNISNYYTARSLAERELRKSRFNREVEITLPFKYMDLPINNPVHLSKARFGWDNKEFLIRKVALQDGGKSRVTLREYSEGVFINSPQTDKSTDTVPPIANLVKPPRELQYVPEVQDPNSTIGKNGELRWLPSFTSDVTYYSVRISGLLDPMVVSVDSLDPALPYIKLDLIGFVAGNYTIEVRAVSSSRGLSSSPAKLILDLNPAKNLPAVSNFRLQNPAVGDAYTWLGNAPIFVWDRIDSLYLGAGNETYLVEVLDADTDVLINSYSTTADTLAYPFTDNKQDYSDNGHGIGVYRNIKARIVALGDDGERSVAWSTL